MDDGTPEDAIAAALIAGRDTEEGWTRVVELQRRGDDATLQAAARLLESADADRRVLAADILGQLGAGDGHAGIAERPVRGPALELLIARLAVEDDPDVVEAIASAIGHFPDARCVAILADLRGHPAESVRHAVVMGLHAREDELAVDTLIELSDDPEAWVRDWATFGLGTMIRRDDQRVREALAARLTDTDDTTRAEAIRGLAVRHDERAIPQLLSELDHGTELDDPAILEEALCALAAHAPDDDLCRHVDRQARQWRTASPNESLPADLQQAVRSCQDNR